MIVEMPRTKKFQSMTEYMRFVKEKHMKEQGAKVKIDLDEYHKKMGGLFGKEVIFHCMPRKTGKTKKANKFFENHRGPSECLFISVDETKQYFFEGTKNKLIVGRTVDANKLSVVNGYGLVIVDNVHLLDKQRTVKILNEFLASQCGTELVCFGTNATDMGKPIQSARHLESVADEVIYDTSACQNCMKIGKTCFTKTIYERPSRHPSDCLVDEEDGFYVEADLCFNCRKYNGNDK